MSNNRLAIDTDFEEIYKIWLNGIKVAFGEYEMPDDLEEQYLKLFQTRNNCFNFWIIEENMEIVGFATLQPSTTNPLKSKEYAEMSVYIKYQGNGYGQKITEYVFNEIKGSPIVSIISYLNEENKVSKSYVFKSGFKEIGRYEHNGKTKIAIHYSNKKR